MSAATGATGLQQTSVLVMMVGVVWWGGVGWGEGWGAEGGGSVPGGGGGWVAAASALLRRRFLQPECEAPRRSS